LTNWGLPADNIRTIYYACVDDEWFTTPAGAGARDPRRLLMCGRLVPWKGQLTFIRAFARIAPSFPQLEGWIAGDGDADYRTALEAEVLALNLHGRIKFLGHQSDVRGLLRQSDISVHCSEREPFGLVLAEAMATGVPMIAADVEGPREIIDPGKTGLLVAPGDVDGYASAMDQLIRDRALRESLAINAYADASARFRASMNVAALEGLMLERAG
jgi:glycosyltransferase involved in cell wall biosynthesis